MLTQEWYEVVYMLTQEAMVKTRTGPDRTDRK